MSKTKSFKMSGLTPDNLKDAENFVIQMATKIKSSCYVCKLLIKTLAQQIMAP